MKFYIGVVILCLGILAGTTAAQSSTPKTQSALAVSPAITEQVLSPGVKTSLVVRVTNITRIPLPIKANVKNLAPLETLLSNADKSTYDASAWFSLEPADFILQPNQTKEITITILPPARATPGGHYATIYFQPLIPTEALSPSTAYLNARVGVLAFLIVRGEITEQAKLGSLQVPRIKQFGPIDIKLPVTNSGNVHVLPDGKVTIRDYRGKVVSTVPLSQGLVLPKTLRQYKFTWDNKGRLGYYTAQAELTYGTDKDDLRSSRVGFWILPWLPIAVTLVLVMVLAIFVLKTRKRWSAAWKVLKGNGPAK